MPTSQTVAAEPRRPRSGTGLRLQRGLLGAGAGLEADLLDVDATGLRVRLADAARPGETMQVIFRPAQGGWPVTRFGAVVGYEAEPGGGGVASIHFRHPLARSELVGLVER